jgi:UDP:flavonoid glycosyltransferase YjiC (YdhE family)
MRVLLSTYGSRGDVDPLVGLAGRLRALGVEVRMCAPPDEDFAQQLAGVGVPMVPVGQSARALAGAPQVVVPQATDQPCWAGRVTDLGIGAAHDGPTPTAESRSAALRIALTPETRVRATAVAGTIRIDGPPVAAKLLLDRSC